MQTPILESIEQTSAGWINKYVLSYRMPNGTKHVYESTSRKPLEAYERELRRDLSQPPTVDALSIVGRTEDDEILLIREFRYPLNRWCIAFPAGLMEPGEDAATCASRELHEETGYRIVEIDGHPAFAQLPQAGYSSTGLTEESVQVCFARVEKDSEAEPEANELIEPFTVPVRELRAFLDANTDPIGTRCQLVLEMYAHCCPQSTAGSYLA